MKEKNIHRDKSNNTKSARLQSSNPEITSFGMSGNRELIPRGQNLERGRILQLRVTCSIKSKIFTDFSRFH